MMQQSHASGGQGGPPGQHGDSSAQQGDFSASGAVGGPPSFGFVTGQPSSQMHGPPGSFQGNLSQQQRPHGSFQSGQGYPGGLQGVFGDFQVGPPGSYQGGGNQYGPPGSFQSASIESQQFQGRMSNFPANQQGLDSVHAALSTNIQQQSFDNSFQLATGNIHDGPPGSFGNDGLRGQPHDMPGGPPVSSGMGSGPLRHQIIMSGSQVGLSDIEEQNESHKSHGMLGPSLGMMRPSQRMISGPCHEIVGGPPQGIGSSPLSGMHGNSRFDTVGGPPRFQSGMNNTLNNLGQGSILNSGGLGGPGNFIQQTMPPQPPPSTFDQSSMPSQAGPVICNSASDINISGIGFPQPLMTLNTRPSDSKNSRILNDDAIKPPTDRLSNALEKVLALKQTRIQEHGLESEHPSFTQSKSQLQQERSDEVSDDFDRVQPSPMTRQIIKSGSVGINLEDGEIHEDEATANRRKEKNRLKKAKKKKSRQRRIETRLAKAANSVSSNSDGVTNTESDSDSDIEVEYVSEEPPELVSEPAFRTYRRVFEHFKITEELADAAKDEKYDRSFEQIPVKARGVLLEEDDDEPETKNVNDVPKISKRQLKKQTRLSVAELKQLVARPDVVEMHDVCSRDPRLLIHLKSYRNTVPVPRHWCAKRKYLQGKRGIEKPPFDLPDFIKATGIMDMRSAAAEKEEAKSMKQKMRERVRPKMGKIDIDYQKLHDAFFKYQSKPRMTLHGDLYYEGKEFETKLKAKKPGILSDDLRTALGMPLGPNADKFPPPWLIAMQRYGPPPSYPNLRVPGLNAAIPEQCSFGYHAGGWGKPPVDETGRPLYGDVFGTTRRVTEPDLVEEEETDRSHWGELESESEEETDDDEDEEEDETAEGGTPHGMVSGLSTPAEGLATPSGVSSVGGAGLETPDMIELRKKTIEEAMEGTDTPALYTVLPEVEAIVTADDFMGSQKTYELPGQKRKRGQGQNSQDGVRQSAAGHSGSQTGGRDDSSGSRSGPASKRYKDFKF